MKVKYDIDYTENEIVKKIVAQNNSGIVVMMAFDKGTEIPTHSANADVIIQIVEGNMEFTMDGDILYLTEGDLIAMTPGTPHSLKATERFKMLLTKLNS